ncbi:MAG: glycerophosphodiester phosphodiesterase [Eubacterium sp.]|nr:glycerophosphodiester phosphodiesterase [Eubacterium sp.]
MSNLILIIVILSAVFFYFFAIAPKMNLGRRKTVSSFSRWDFAHRGLWNLEQGIPENSMPAFIEAMRQHTAIELDVRLTKDHKLVVIHDSSLNRLCRVNGVVEKLTYAQLSALKLCGTEYGIPLLDEVLQTVRGRVPLLIEIKTYGSDLTICSCLFKKLEFYNGRYLVQSFDPFALRWFSRNAPHVLTGQLAGVPPTTERRGFFATLLSYILVINVISRPDFISYELHHADFLSVKINKHLYRTPIFVWTARTMNDYRQAKALFTSVIFEKITP